MLIHPFEKGLGDWIPGGRTDDRIDHALGTERRNAGSVALVNPLLDDARPEDR